jgi:hypothetical protein
MESRRDSQEMFLALSQKEGVVGSKREECRQGYSKVEKGVVGLREEY